MQRMRIGEIFRYARPYSAELSEIDGYPNFFYKIRLENYPMALIESGINPIGRVTSAGETRTPAILLSSSPHKIGSDHTPWQDFHEPDLGYVRYFGDAKESGEDPALRPGNKAMLRAKQLFDSSDSAVRNSAPPIAVFRRERDAVRTKGLPSFQGFGIIERAELISQFNPNSGQSFANYVFEIAILAMEEENEQFDWSWINARRQKEYSMSETLKLAPASWKRWVRGGKSEISAVRRRVSKLLVTKTDEQRPIPNTRSAQAVDDIYRFYDNRKSRFELLAGMITQRIMEQRGGDCELGWVTRASSDGGADFVCRLDLGEGFSSLKQVVFGQAKCESPDSTTSGKDVARTVARLRRGWIGSYVTLGAFSEPVQREVIEDEYPLLLVPGRKVGEEVDAMAQEAGYNSVEAYLSEIVDPQYDDYVHDRKAEEILKP